MAKLTPVFVDLETYWSQTHSLSKMNPIVYCTHPETEIISCAVKVGSGQTQVVFGERLVKSFLASQSWDDKLVVGHNMSQFDAMILAWRCGVRPALWGCTLAMARPHHSKTTGLSLAKLVAHYGIGVKDSTALRNTKGRHLCDFTQAEVNAMREYNKADTDQCAELFYKLRALTSNREMKLIDMTIRMLVTPKFRVDVLLLEATLEKEVLRKHEMLLRLANMLGVLEPGMTDDEATEQVKKTLGSAPQFSALLESLGVQVPTKLNTKGVSIPALAKTDEEFVALQEHDDPIVAAAAGARLGVKSTILESRIGTLLDVAAATGGRLPVPINYYGADTTGRDSGAMNLNLQNLTRILPGAPKLTDALRYSLKAPKNHKVVVADLSGIELRVNMFLWKVPYAMALFQADPEKADLYKTLASEVLCIPYDDIVKMQRQAGKAMHLGCGFGLGSTAKYRAVAKGMAQIDVSEEDATEHIAGYRRKHPEVVQGWKTCHGALPAIYHGAEYQIDPWGLCHTVKGGIKTPQGMILYPDLREEVDENGRREWVYGRGRHKARIYAGKVTENIVQHLAREVVMDNALQVKKEIGINTTHRVHDELVYVVPENIAEIVLDAVQDVMRTPPAWWPELVTWSEGSIGATYGAAK